MHKFRTKFLTTALVATLVFGSVPADAVNAQAVGADSDATQAETIADAAVEEVTEIVESEDEIVEEATEETADEILEETETVEEETVETVSVDEPMELAAGETLAVNETNFPDAIFRSYILKEFDPDGNGYIDPSKVTRIFVLRNSWDEKIKTLQGIEYFTELVYLNCEGNNLSTIDLSKNTKLQTLYCSGRSGFLVFGLDLDVSKNTELEFLYCRYVTSLDVSKNTKLQILDCSEGRLTSLDVSQNTELLELKCDLNDLTSLDVSKNTKLHTLQCGANDLTSLDVSKNTELQNLYCWGNDLTGLDVSKNTKLERLWCESNYITGLDVSKNTELEWLDCRENNITSLDLSKNTKLEWLYCESNYITSLDVSQNTKLASFSFDYDLINEIDLSNAKSLSYLELHFDQLPITGTLNLSKIKGCRIMDDMSAVSYDLSERDYRVSTDKGDIIIHAARIEGIDAIAPDAFKITGIYHAEQNRNGILAGLCTEGKDKALIEYSWYVCKDGKNWILAQDWKSGNEWLSYTPDEYGDYVLVGKARYRDSGRVAVKEATSYFSFHPEIKGMCQMPYEGEGGGYLIGVESYENPGQKYQYEMLILDCTLLAEGKDAWIYTTGRCGVADGSAFWTIWQPQYGYYWTLFRVYDEKGNLIDETCYGFVNAY